MGRSDFGIKEFETKLTDYDIINIFKDLISVSTHEAIFNKGIQTKSDSDNSIFKIKLGVPETLIIYLIKNVICPVVIDFLFKESPLKIPIYTLSHFTVKKT